MKMFFLINSRTRHLIYFLTQHWKLTSFQTWAGKNLLQNQRPQSKDDPIFTHARALFIDSIKIFPRKLEYWPKIKSVQFWCHLFIFWNRKGKKHEPRCWMTFVLNFQTSPAKWVPINLSQVCHFSFATLEDAGAWFASRICVSQKYIFNPRLLPFIS